MCILIKNYKDSRIKSQKIEITQLKNNVRKISKKCLQSHGLVKKKTSIKLDNQISNFGELERGKYLNISP